MGLENPVHLLFIGAVALMVLGPKRLPALARAVGQGFREFREALNGELNDTGGHPGPTESVDPGAQPPSEEQSS